MPKTTCSIPGEAHWCWVQQDNHLLWSAGSAAFNTDNQISVHLLLSQPGSWYQNSASCRSKRLIVRVLFDRWDSTAMRRFNIWRKWLLTAQNNSGTWEVVPAYRNSQHPNVLSMFLLTKLKSPTSPSPSVHSLANSNLFLRFPNWKSLIYF